MPCGAPMQNRLQKAVRAVPIHHHRCWPNRPANTGTVNKSHTARHCQNVAQKARRCEGGVQPELSSPHLLNSRHRQACPCCLRRQRLNLRHQPRRPRPLRRPAGQRRAQAGQQPARGAPEPVPAALRRRRRLSLRHRPRRPRPPGLPAGQRRARARAGQRAPEPAAQSAEVPGSPAAAPARVPPSAAPRLLDLGTRRSVFS
mmetsp:Transcript_52926/g.170816  ORF Transcript_52926/g.170816 Transcript_52926/m.170816 type:complete len:201 (-) Transcript_52926:1177-1779(-)